MGKKKKKKYWSTDRIVSFSAILISFVTLMVFIHQTNLMAEQQRLSTMPYLSFGFIGSGTPNFAVYISNNGIGPAFVESIEISYQDSTYQMDLPSFLYSGNVPGMDSIDNVFHANIISGQLIPAGREILILEVDNSQEDADRLLRLLLESGIEAELIYRSAYNERWRLHSNRRIPELID